jgi:hypothetical protein
MAFLPSDRAFVSATSSVTLSSTEAKRVLTPFSVAMTARVTDCSAEDL